MWTAAASVSEPAPLEHPGRRTWLGQVACGLAAAGLSGLPRLSRAAEALRVGVSLPLSGESASVGQALLAGLQAGLAGAQVRGRVLELVALDDAGQDTQALKNAQTLVADPQTIALLGSLGAAANLALLPVLDSARLPLIGPVTGSERLRASASPWLFPLRAGLQDEAARVVNQFDHQSLDDLAVVSSPDHFGQEAEAALQLEMNRAVMRPVALQRLAAAPGELQAVVARVAAAQPQAVIVAAPPLLAGAFIRRWSAGGYRASVAVFSETGLGLHAHLGEQVRGVVVSQVLPSPWHTARPLVREYQAALRALAPGPVDRTERYSYGSLEGYVNAGVLVKALQLTGSTNPSREALAQALQNGRFDVDAMPLRFGAPPRRGGRFCEMTVLGADGVARR